MIGILSLERSNTKFHENTFFKCLFDIVLKTGKLIKTWYQYKFSFCSPNFSVNFFGEWLNLYHNGLWKWIDRVIVS